MPKRLRRGASPRGLPGPVVIYRSRRQRARAAGISGGPQRLRTGPAGLRGRAWGSSGANTDLKKKKKPEGRNLLPPGLSSPGGRGRVGRPGPSATAIPRGLGGSGARGSPAGQGQPPALGPPDPLVPRAPPPGGWGTLPSAHPRPGVQGRAGRQPALEGSRRARGEAHGCSKPFTCILCEKQGRGRRDPASSSARNSVRAASLAAAAAASAALPGGGSSSLPQVLHRQVWSSVRFKGPSF